MWLPIIIGVAFVAVFAFAWWRIFRGVRRYPNLHNLHDNQSDVL